MKKIVLLFAFLIAGSFAFAQEEMKPEKYTDVTWHEVVLVNFYPGKEEKAKEIIEKFKAAGQADEAPEMYWFKTGSHDLMLIWHMRGGPSDMEWKRSESNIKWFTKLAEQQGGPEKAEKLLDEYASLIKGGESFIVMKEE